MVVKMQRYDGEFQDGGNILYLGKTSFGLEFRVLDHREILPVNQLKSRLGHHDVELIDFSDERVMLNFIRRRMPDTG